MKDGVVVEDELDGTLCRKGMVLKNLKATRKMTMQRGTLIKYYLFVVKVC